MDSHLILRIKVDPAVYMWINYTPIYWTRQGLPLAIESNVTQGAPFVTTPSKHRKRDWNRHIDTNLTNIHFGLKFACCCAGLREDDSTIAVAVCIDDIKSVVQCVGRNDSERRAKNFLTSIGIRHNMLDKGRKYQPIALHSGCSFNYGRANKITIGVAWYNDSSSVKMNMAAIFHRGRYESLHTTLCGGRDERATVQRLDMKPELIKIGSYVQICTTFKSSINSKLPCAFDQLREPRLCSPN